MLLLLYVLLLFKYLLSLLIPSLLYQSEIIIINMHNELVHFVKYIAKLCHVGLIRTGFLGE